MKFSDIPGHESAKARLRAMIDADRLPHALLLEGPEGVGKFALARAAAQYIHCENRTPDGDSCGVCPACVQHQTFNHIDTHFVFPVTKRKAVNAFSDDYLEEWREFVTANPFMDFREWLVALEAGNTQPAIYASESEQLVKKLSYTSHRARYKIVLVWLAERMNVEAANKLLKQIEEPFGDTLFLLTTNDAKSILPTIYSRTQRIELKRLPDELVASWLVQSLAIDPADALAVAHIAEGNMIAARAGVELGNERRSWLTLFIRLMRSAYSRNVRDLKEWASEVASLGREPMLGFLDYCARLVRENFVYNLRVAELRYLNREEAAFSVNFARFINERNVLQLVNELDIASRDIAGNANGKIVLFDLAVKVIILLKA